MQIWTDKLPLNASHPIIPQKLQMGDLFLDIETTGLSRDKHQVYLIGSAVLVDDNIIYVNQWFADCPDDEKLILSDFSDFLASMNLKRIITFNGNGFDLPFLLARAGRLGVVLDFSAYELTDIYKEVKKYKTILHLQNYRQKTLEQFLGIHREDPYSGGELIKVYENYVRRPDPAAASLLKLHNYEDVLGMIDLLPIFSYDALLSSPPQIASATVERYTDLDGSPAEELILSLTPPYPLPGKLSCKHPVTGAYLFAYLDTAKLRVPLYHGMARLYYLDYKNYFYLPAEDMAIHKSVAAYVDKAHREKAAPENCYTKIEVTKEFLESEKLAEYAGHVLRGFYSNYIRKNS